MITKAVIACGGWSTRFLPAVKAYAKHLVPVLDKPQIQLVIEEMISAGITDICLIVRHGETTLRHYFSHDPELDIYLKKTGKEFLLESWYQLMSKCKIKIISQPRHLPYGNGSPILAAKTFIGKDSFVYAWGDDLTIEDTPGLFIKKMIKLFDKYQPATIQAIQQVPWEEIHRYGSMKFVSDPKYPGRVDAVLEKEPRETAPSNFANCGRFIVNSKIIPILEKKQTGKGNELWFVDAVNQLAKTDVVLTLNHQEHNSYWTTTGDPLNWLKANIILALQHPKYSPEIKQFLKKIPKLTD